MRIRIHTTLGIGLASLFYGCSGGNDESSTFNVVVGVIILGIIIFPILKKILRDKVEGSVHLESTPLTTSLDAFINELDCYLYGNQGKITIISKTKFTLSKIDSNQVIEFKYGIYGLIVTWKYQQKEVVRKYSHGFPDIHIQNPLSRGQQIGMAERFLYHLSIEADKLEKEGITIEIFNKKIEG